MPGQATDGRRHDPLALCGRYGLSALSIIATGAPGTLWIQYGSGAGHLPLRAFALTDPDAWVRRVNDCYERPLMKIFP